jgi:hypothetical protein
MKDYEVLIRNPRLLEIIAAIASLDRHVLDEDENEFTAILIVRPGNKIETNTPHVLIVEYEPNDEPDHCFEGFKIIKAKPKAEDPDLKEFEKLKAQYERKKISMALKKAITAGIDDQETIDKGNKIVDDLLDSFDAFAKRFEDLGKKSE